MLGKLVSGLFNTLPAISSSSIRQLSTIFNAAPAVSKTIAGGGWSLTPVRTHIRYHFPRPSETKRIKKHGWAKRMSTPEGRRVLMRRILKGKHCLSH